MADHSSDFVNPDGGMYINATAGASTTGRWLDLGRFGATGFSFHIENTTNTGTMALEASNDPRCDLNHPDTANADFDDISAAVTTFTMAVAGSVDGYINMSNFRMRFVRLKWTNSTGSSALKVYANVR